VPAPMNLFRARLAALVAVPVLFAGGPAAAQTIQSSTIAEALFQDAQAHLAAGKIHEACDLFARSQKVEPTTGTLLNLATCHEREGKTVTAWTEFSSAAGLATRSGDTARAQFANAHIAALEKRLHRVAIDLMDPPKDAVVLLDGESLAREGWGTPIPLDPGEHAIEVRAPGFANWVRKVNLGPASGTDHIEVRLVPDAVAAAPPPPSTAPDSHVTPDMPPSRPPPPVEESHGNSARTAGFIVGGVGVAGIAVGAAFGVATLNNLSARNQLCTPGVPCGNQAAFSDDHSARVDQTWMLVTGGVGIAALGVGGYLVASSYLKKKGLESGALQIVPVLGPQPGISFLRSF